MCCIIIYEQLYILLCSLRLVFFYLTIHSHIVCFSLLTPPQDGKAYLSDEKWNNMLAKRGVTEADLRDTRYNACFHLVTAADGAEAFYTLGTLLRLFSSMNQDQELYYLH